MLVGLRKLLLFSAPEEVLDCCASEEEHNEIQASKKNMHRIDDKNPSVKVRERKMATQPFYRRQDKRSQRW